ncbi:hypothetical protein [Bradyrhizobium sp. LB11.1]|uniref:hypothetical protein n=1 Tax=Bradyrhizobium sp. LB11.1 TaxID=3156326 RepID=UPI003399A7E7
MEPSTLPWTLREHPTLPCFIQGPTNPELGYALEIMGDDYSGYGDREQRQTDAEFIVRACNAHEQLVNALQHIEQRIDNLRAAGKIPMPDSLRVLALGESPESLQRSARRSRGGAVIAVVGFLFLMTIGVIRIIAAVAALVVITRFSGKPEWPAVIAALAVGGFVLWMALSHSPIAFTFAT